jgi:hypothetical protein
MTLRGWARNRRVRSLGIGLLVLSLVHTPLPKADFHNIRHHDGPGQVCRYHDHLLRWHPEAFGAQDVAVLHWHWFLPVPGGAQPVSGAGGPVAHSQLPDWSGLAWDQTPQLAPEARARFIARAAPIRPLSCLVQGLAMVDALSVRAGPHPVHSFGATFARRVSSTSLLNRWTC